MVLSGAASPQQLVSNAAATAAAFIIAGSPVICKIVLVLTVLFTHVYKCATASQFRPMVLSGASSPQQLVSNAAATALAPRLGISGSGEAEVLARLMRDMRVDAEQYWQERSALAWN
jgi:hypothetical protein